MTTSRRDVPPAELDDNAALGAHDTAPTETHLFVGGLFRAPASCVDESTTIAQPTRAADSSSRARSSVTWRPTRFIVRVAVVLAAVGVLGASVFWVTGGRWFSVATPSMGTAAPVGTFIATRPTDVADLHVGDVVAFVPPTEPDVTYTHRIVTIERAGTAAATFSTRGDINGSADPWTLTQHDLVGRAVLIAPGAGYLLRATPLWLLGSLIVATVTRFWVRPSWQAPVQMVGAAVLYLVAALTIRPFLAIVQLVTTTDTDGTAHISAVSTGLLPVRLAAVAGHGVATPVDLTYGRTGMIDLHPDPSNTGGGGGSYQVAAHLHLPWWGWVAIIAFWSLPTVLAVIGSRRRARRHRSDTFRDDTMYDETHERLGTPDEVMA